MTPDEELERATEAAYARFRSQPNRDVVGTLTWGQLNPSVKDSWRDFMRAGINAIRPTGDSK
jgi:hypothetical protein